MQRSVSTCEHGEKQINVTKLNTATGGNATFLYISHGVQTVHSSKEQTAISCTLLLFESNDSRHNIFFELSRIQTVLYIISICSNLFSCLNSLVHSFILEEEGCPRGLPPTRRHSHCSHQFYTAHRRLSRLRFRPLWRFSFSETSLRGTASH